MTQKTKIPEKKQKYSASKWLMAPFHWTMTAKPKWVNKKSPHRPASTSPRIRIGTGTGAGPTSSPRICIGTGTGISTPPASPSVPSVRTSPELTHLLLRMLLFGIDASGDQCDSAEGGDSLGQHDDDIYVFAILYCVNFVDCCNSLWFLSGHLDHLSIFPFSFRKERDQFRSVSLFQTSPP